MTFVPFLYIVVPHYKREKKSIRGFCPHHRCGARQSLAKPWVQENLLNVNLLLT